MSTAVLSAAPPLPPRTQIKRLCLKFVVLLALLGAVIAACYLIKLPAMMTESGVVMKLPDKVLGFVGKDEPISEGELELPKDTEFAKKSYLDADGDRILSQIVLSGVEHRSIHRPEMCLSGQGWSVNLGQVIDVPLKSGRTIKAMVLDISRPWRTPGGETIQIPALYLYFFVSKDAETARHFDRIAITNLDLLLHNKAHRWAYVIAMTDILKGLTPNGKNREQALQMLKDFVRESAPSFLKSEMLSPSAPSPKS